MCQQFMIIFATIDQLICNVLRVRVWKMEIEIINVIVLFLVAAAVALLAVFGYRHILYIDVLLFQSGSMHHSIRLYYYIIDVLAVLFGHQKYRHRIKHFSVTQ